MKKGLLIIVVLVLVAAGVAPAGFGYWAGDRFDAMVEKMEETGLVEIKEVSTQRGWFQSTSEMVVEVSGDIGQAYQAYQEKADGGDAQPLRLRFRNHIHHGPMPLTAGGEGAMIPTVGLVSSELIAVGDEPVTRDDMPLDIETRLGLAGGGVTTLAMPGDTVSLGGGAAHMEWQGLSGRIRFSGNLEEVETHFSLPRVEVTDQQAHVLLTDAQLRTDTHEGIEGLSLGGASFEVASLDVEPSNGQNVRMRELSIDVESGEGDENLIDSRVDMRVGELRAEELRFGPASYSLALRRLDAASLAKIQKAAEELQKKDLPQDQMSMMMGATMIGVLPELLKKGPVLEIDEVRVDSDYGKVNGKGRLTVDTSNPMVLSNPMLLKDAVVASAELAIPETLLVALAARGLKKELSTLDMDYSEDQIQSMARVRIQNRMASPPVGRFFALQDGVYKFEGSIEKGQVTINGKPFNPAAMRQP